MSQPGTSSPLIDEIIRRYKSKDPDLLQRLDYVNQLPARRGGDFATSTLLIAFTIQ
jgi:hypothetical protein